jgi:hypothetical protein
MTAAELLAGIRRNHGQLPYEFYAMDPADMPADERERALKARAEGAEKMARLEKRNQETIHARTNDHRR